MLDKPWLAAGLVIAVAGTTVLIAAAAHFSFFFLPFTWTNEPARLIDLLGIRPGDRVADIGAGDGTHAVAVARLIGQDGEVLASDIDPDRRRAIADRAAREHASNVRVVEAARDSTNLADRCCRAIYMRTMFHHVADPGAYALDVVRSLQPGGRVAVIDFAPWPTLVPRPRSRREARGCPVRVHRRRLYAPASRRPLGRTDILAGV